VITGVIMQHVSKIRRIHSHPLVTPAKLREIRRLRQKIEREEKDRIIVQARQSFDRHDRIRKMLDILNMLREKKRVTLAELSLRTGIGKANLSRLFNNQQANPRIDTLLKVSDALDFELLAGR